MFQLFNDLRAWVLLLLLGLGSVGGWVLDRASAGLRDVPEAHLALARPAVALDELPPRLGDRLDAAHLASLAARLSLADSWDINPLAGAHRSPIDLGEAGTVSAPDGFGSALAAGVGASDPADAVALALDRAMEAVRVPCGRVDATPGLWADLRVRAAQGLAAELARQAERLAKAPAVHHRPRVLLASSGNGTPFGTQDVGVERETYLAWNQLLSEWYSEHDVPWEQFDLAVPHGAWQPSTDTERVAFGLERTWYPGWYDVGGWLDRWRPGENSEGDPLVALGRLQAINLLARAGLVEVVFAGHGRQVVDPTFDSDWLGAYRLGDLSAGDECEELVILRGGRGGPSIRYGLCLGPAESLFALSCSSVTDGISAPQFNSAAVAFFLDHGMVPPFEVVEPMGLHLQSQLRLTIRESRTADAMRRGVRAAVDRARGHMDAAEVITGISALADEAWLVATGGIESPDLLVLGPDVDHWDAAADARLALATTTFRVLRPTRSSGSGRREAELVTACGHQPDCIDTLDQLIEQARRRGGVPQGAPGLTIDLDGDAFEVVAAPNHTQAWVRLAVLRADREPDRAYLDRAARLRVAIGARRVPGILLTDRSGRALDSAELDLRSSTLAQEAP